MDWGVGNQRWKSANLQYRLEDWTTIKEIGKLYPHLCTVYMIHVFYRYRIQNLSQIQEYMKAEEKHCRFAGDCDS